MKKLIIINGAPGIGKSTTCKELYQRLENAVWLDGDWCWMMNPFVVTEENKRMVENNIVYLLRSFLNNSSYNYVVFNWVIHKEFIFDMLLDRLKDLEFELFKITLICTEEALAERARLDGRSPEHIEVGLDRLREYKEMNTNKVDTTNRSINQTVEQILEIIR